jgi:hypothetical protein
VTAAGRYIGWDSVAGFPSIGKNLSLAEAHELLVAGIEIFLAFEYQPDAAANGTPQGTKDGQLAKAQLAELEAPPDMCSYFAVDFDIPDYAPSLPDTPQNAFAKLGPVGHYFQAINALKFAYEVGGYGGYYAIKRLLDAKLITKAWQTVAWSGGHLDTRAVLYQVVSTSPIVGADIDVREHVTTVADFGQWPRPVTKPDPPTNPPIPQEADMAYPMVLELPKGSAVVLPVPAGKTKVVLYADPGASTGVAPHVRVGTSPKWTVIDMAPVWANPAQSTFPVGTNELTLARADAGNTPVTVDFA